MKRYPVLFLIQHIFPCHSVPSVVREPTLPTLSGFRLCVNPPKNPNPTSSPTRERGDGIPRAGQKSIIHQQPRAKRNIRHTVTNTHNVAEASRFGSLPGGFIVVTHPAALCASIGMRDPVLDAAFGDFCFAYGYESPGLRRGLLVGYSVLLPHGIRFPARPLLP